MAMNMTVNTMVSLRIEEAKNLPAKDISGKSDPYCIVKIDNEIVARTATVWKDLEPFWGEEYRLFLPGGFTNLSIYIYDEDTIGGDDRIGKVTFDREVLSHSPRGLDKWFQLSAAHNDLDVQGEVRLETTLIDKGNTKKIRVRVMEVRDLAEKGTCGCLQPQVKLSLKEMKPRLAPRLSCRTDAQAHSIEMREELSLSEFQVTTKSWLPFVEETLDFEVLESLPDTKLVAEVQDSAEGHNTLGQAIILFSKQEIGQTKDSWYKLFAPPQVKVHRESSLGSIRLGVRLSEERILPSQFYQPLVRMLVDSVSSSDVTANQHTALSVLEELTTADIKALAHELVKLFLGQDLVIPFLDYITTREIKKTGNPNVLFRGNTLATKCMDEFMKIVGIPYLCEQLKPIIDKIFEEHKSCEIDPSKQARRPSTRNSDEHDATAKKVRTLQGYLHAIMSSILNSVDACPAYMRVAFRNLSQRVSEHYKGHIQCEDVHYRAISGFLFLRLFAPAILAPKLFSLRDHHADKTVSRTLTLLAKTVQKIGNLDPKITDTGSWVSPLYTSVQRYSEQVKDFLDILTDAEDSQVPECNRKRSVFSQSMVIKEGYLRKCTYNPLRLPKPFSFKKRYCWLSSENFLYGYTPESQTRQFLPTFRLLAAERVEDCAFQKPNVFQLVTGEVKGSLHTTYLAAQDVNEMHQWLSAIRKTFVSNTEVLPLYHPGIYHKSKWSCCKRVRKTAPGCHQTHTHVTLSDWRDPLDPDCEAQMIYSQLLMSRDELKQKYTVTSTETPTAAPEMDIAPSEASNDAKAAALHLFEVIDELEIAHKSLEPRERHITEQEAK